MVLFDTNIFIEYYKQNYQVKEEFEKLNSDNICTSVVCTAGLYYGVLNKNEFKIIKNTMSRINMLQINRDISESAIQLMQAYILSHKVNFADFLIAATCLHHKLELFTLNKKDFRFIPASGFK